MFLRSYLTQLQRATTEAGSGNRRSGRPARRLVTAFAAMTALELAETADAVTEPIQAVVTLAGQAPAA